MKKKLLLVLVVLMLVGNVSGVYIGTAPGVKDLGEVQRGETYTVKFYTTASGFNSDITVTPSTFRPNSRFYAQEGGTYEFKPKEASQEDVQPWINFRREEFEVTQESRTVKVGGSRAEVNGEVEFFLDVPRNAEPGYHAVGVDLQPNFDESTSGQQVNTLSLSQFYLVFRVPGEAKRDIQIRNVEGLRAGDNHVRVNLQVRNTGTVTTQVRPADHNLFNPMNGQQIDQLKTSRTYIAPGQVKDLSTSWTMDQNIEAGSYRMRGSLDYITGNAIFDDSFDVTSFIQIQPSNEQNNSGEGSTSGQASESQASMWLVLMVIVAVGVLMYSFEIDPIWIISIVGLLGLSSFILMTGLPVYLIGIVLILTGAIFVVG